MVQGFSMGSVFGKSKSSTAHLVSERDRAILELKNARDRLKKYQKKLESEKKVLEQKSLELWKSGKRDRAKLTLRMKEFKESQMDKADAQLLTVMQMVRSEALSSAQRFRSTRSNGRLTKFKCLKDSRPAMPCWMRFTR